MKSYIDVLAFLNEQISQLNHAQSQIFLHNIIQDFVKKLPHDWLDNELDDEKIFYHKLAQLLLQDDWDLSAIEQQIKELDDIMEAMGELYPHSTDAYALAVLTMMDYYLQFIAEHDDFHGYAMGVADEYMTMADFEADCDDTDNWLDYPIIATAFDKLNAIINESKQ